jgi:AhpD family alkylhydroperoxidase
MTNNRVFKFREQLNNIYFGAKGFVILKSSKKLKYMNRKFKERIMLAITEVNGCEMCSYMHTKLALSSGMNAEDIKNILDGDTSNIPLDEAVAVMFAQDFAYSKEAPSKDSVDRLIQEYGTEKADRIVAVCNVITMTNGMGTSLDYLYKRIKFKRNKNSNILIELLNPLLTMLLFPVFTIYFFIKTFIGFRPKTLKRVLAN